MFASPRRTSPRPCLSVETLTKDNEVEESYLGFIVGTGLIAQFFRLYYERGAPGYRGSAQLVARIFIDSFYGGPLAQQVLSPMPCRLEVNGQQMAAPAWSLICSAVVRNLGLHMLLTHRAAEDPNRPHLVATPLPPRQLGPRAPRVLTGRQLGGENTIDKLVDNFTVYFDQSNAFVLDGELLEAPAFRVSAGPMLQVMSAEA